MHLTKISIVLIGLFYSVLINAEPLTLELNLADDEDQDYAVTVYPVNPSVDQKLTVIWLEELDHPRVAFEELMTDLQTAGITVWRISLLDSYFLERSANNVRNLSGKGVLALLNAASTHNNHKYMVVAADRMSVPALRGVRLWQAQGKPDPQFSGVTLIYPNLYKAAPAAGTPPQLLPIVTAVNFPLFVFQPERGVLRVRLKELITGLQFSGGTPFVLEIKNNRDWYFMHPKSQNKAIRQAVMAMPRQLIQAANMMNKMGSGKISTLAQSSAKITLKSSKQPTVRGLVSTTSPYEPPSFNLQATRGGYQSLKDSKGKVTLVNFWASWCPPCVKEIPSMNSLLAQYQDQDFQLVSINFKESPELIRRFMEKVKVDFPVLQDPDGMTSAQWDIFAFPSTFILDKEGFVRYSVNSAIEWDNEEVKMIVDELLK